MAGAVACSRLSFARRFTRARGGMHEQARSSSLARPRFRPTMLRRRGADQPDPSFRLNSVLICPERYRAPASAPPARRPSPSSR